MGVARKRGSFHLILLAVGAEILAPGAVALSVPAQGCSRSHTNSNETRPVSVDGGFTVDGGVRESDAGNGDGTGSYGGNDGAMGYGDARDGDGIGNDGDRDGDTDGSAIDGDVADGCRQIQADITLQGNVIYNDYESGFVKIFVFESSSERCTDDPHIAVSRQPGDLVGELELDGPGPFEIAVTITWLDGGDRPDLAVLAIHKPSDEGKCEGGGLVSLSGVDHDDIEMVMETGQCPTLE